MKEFINASDLPDFFAPFAEEGHKCSQSVHLHCCIIREIGCDECEWAQFGAGYVRRVHDDAVVKYDSGTNSNEIVRFETINRITVHDITGKQLRELKVQHD